ncbi:hypothetical protein [Bdellovibrio bacteriovorus]|uniref:hypothetical protein n=1 Tax=Bdellovibrio TaxID=958 RepID=UPI0035A8E38A
MKKNKLSFKLFLSAQLVVATLFTATVPYSALAQGPQCAELFLAEGGASALSAAKVSKIGTLKEIRESLETNYKERNNILAKRYPSLEFVFKDPEAFVKTMKQRFETQKQITPEDPRLFDFPEAAPTMKEIRADLEKFRQELIVELQKEKGSFANKASHMLLGKRSGKVETTTKVLQYINKVQNDIDTMVNSNSYPYRDTVYTLYYYSRVRGFFQFKELGAYHQVAKYIDMAMHGYRRLNIDAELRLYESKGSPIIQVRSGRIAHEFRVAEVPFRDAFERKDSLEFVIIPSVYALGSSAFLHVLPHKIHFLGATNTPVPADGFNRPGGLFWMHDVRHEADRYMKVNAYQKAQNLTPKQEETLALLQQKWQADFLKMKNSVQDPNIKAALEHYHFYTHHDVGVPLTPSMFLNHHKDGMSVYYAFLWHKKNAKQDPEFKDWFKSTKKAQEILTEFWTERLPLEKQLLQKDPVKIKNWEEWFPMSHTQTKTQTSVFNKAIESGALVRISTERNGVDGTLSKVIYSQQGEPIYLQFSGKARLVDSANEVIPGQDINVHAQGYSSPVGKIKSVMADGQLVTANSLQANQKVEIQYESGITVRGELSRVTRDLAQSPSVLTFSSAEVHLNDKALYKPEWGSFDLILGEQIKKVEFLLSMEK